MGEEQRAGHKRHLPRELTEFAIDLLLAPAANYRKHSTHENQGTKS